MTLSPGARRKARLSLICALALASSAAADMQVLHNVNGYTLTRNGLQSFSGLVITNGKIERLLGAKDSLPRGAQLIDGGGKTALPGLTDSHGHVFELGKERLDIDLRGSSSLDEALARIRKYAAANPDARWIVGRGWNQVLWKEQRFPTASELDTATGARPAYLQRVDGHAAWANSAALKISGIIRTTADPLGGQIVRDGKGDATGALIDAAMLLVEQQVPLATDAEVKRTLQAATCELAALGMTGVHDAGIDDRQYRQYEELAATGQLPIRIYAMLMDGKEARRLMESGPRLPHYEDRLQMRAVKAQVDGALGSRGAALLEGYSDQPHHRGLMLYEPEQFRSLVTLTASKGWQLNVHAIGDAANHLVLDSFEQLLTPRQRAALRPRIEHAQIIAPGDIARFARLGVIASIQPTHATSDMNMAEDRIGPARIEGAYAWRKLLDAGVRLTGGSDFPVELANPWHGLYAAVTRQDRNGRPPGGWRPQDKLSREEALRLFTLDAAFASHMETATGSLEPGKWADFILIDRDYFKVPADQIDDIHVLATYVAGHLVTSVTADKAE